MTEQSDKQTDSHGWIQTFSGKKMYLLEPTADMICIEDIAHALSMICRFGGHTKKFYSVAEHSWWMSTFIFQGEPATLRLYALLHDAAEAYVGDMVRPLKHTDDFEHFRYTEDVIENVIYNKFGLTWPAPTVIKQADRKMLEHEIADKNVAGPALFLTEREHQPSHPIIPTGAWNWTPAKAEEMFLYQFRELTTQII